MATNDSLDLIGEGSVFSPTQYTVGPSGSTDNAITRFDGTTGLLVQDSGITLDDDGRVALGSSDGSNTTKRMTMNTYERAVNPNHYGELLRLDWSNDDAKPTIAFRDETGKSHAWLMAHKFLQIVDADKRKTFVDADVNTTTDVITITSHGFSTADAAWFYSTAELPTGIALSQRYFVRALSSSTVAVYRTSADASADTNRLNITAATGGGTHTMDSNNFHNHVGIEVKNQSDDTLNTKFEIELDRDNPYIRALSNFQVKSFPMYITGIYGTNKDLIFGLDETSVGKRWAIRTNSTSESGSNAGSDLDIVGYTDAGSATTYATFTRSSGALQLNTTTLTVQSGGTGTVRVRRVASTSFASSTIMDNATDQWSLQVRNDSTQTLHLRDVVNGVSAFSIFQGATKGYMVYPELGANPSASELTSGSNAKDRFSMYMRNDKLVFAYNNAGTVTYITIPMDGSTTTWTHSTSTP